MKLKAKGTPVNNAGVYKAEIENISYYKDDEGNLIQNHEGENALEFDIKISKDKSIRELFWWGGSSMFRLRKLLKAIGVDTSEGAVDADEAIGIPFWLVIKEIKTYEGDTLVESKSVLADFVKASSKKPAFSLDDLVEEIREEVAEEPEEELEEDGF